MNNIIVILEKVFKFGGIPISISQCKFLAFFSLLKKIPYVVTRDVRLSFEEKTIDNSSEH